MSLNKISRFVSNHQFLNDFPSKNNDFDEFGQNLRISPFVKKYNSEFEKKKATILRLVWDWAVMDLGLISGSTVDLGLIWD